MKKKSMVYYKMNSQTIVMCVVAFLIGMLLVHMLKNVCGCNKVVEGGTFTNYCERNGCAPGRVEEGLTEAILSDTDSTDTKEGGTGWCKKAELVWGCQDCVVGGASYPC